MATATDRTYDLRTFCSVEFRAMVSAGILSRQDCEAVLSGRYRFTADQYQAMGMAGILSEYEPIELVNGEIVEMAPIGNAHNDSTDCITPMLIFALNGRARVRVRGSVRINRISEPQPDFAILRQRTDYHLSPATPADALFIVSFPVSGFWSGMVGPESDAG